ncbi:uncharacterized protein LOC133200513 [Saccostrea echinata]|uniref:uncharacterized protein LOC133200513 n=1 Tax=Saccostrea echinata TaxID=191078 RepID=UPI002A7FCD1D|nr:uncharacterized protein LOC133200513 [Saccostrea echinata]
MEEQTEGWKDSATLLMETETRPTTTCIKGIKTDLGVLFQLFICIFFLILFNGSLASQRQKRGAREPCADSLKTVTVVKSCPKDKDTWEKRAKQKNCGDVPRNCSATDFVYHCILDEFGKSLLELCAGTTEIIARFCSEFSTGGMFVQEHAEKPCKRCPFAYNSSMSYLYNECYELPESTVTTTYIDSTTKRQQQTTRERYSNSTSMPEYDEAQVEFNLSSSIVYTSLGIFVPIFSIFIMSSVLWICTKGAKKKMKLEQSKMKLEQSKLKDIEGIDWPPSPKQANMRGTCPGKHGGDPIVDQRDTDNNSENLQKQSTYIKDTTDFINKIETFKLPDDVLLITYDVTSMYTNMEFDELLSAVNEAYQSANKPQREIPYPNAEDLIFLLKCVLENNYFEFNGK